jgi:hypothetical protein
MVDEMDPELNAATERQDTTDAARFRADAAKLSTEAGHDRTEAEDLRRMGLATDADQKAKEAASLDTRSTDFTHRAELLDEALGHRKTAEQDLAGATQAHGLAGEAKTKGDHFQDEALLSFGSDVSETVRLTAEMGAARGTETAMRDLEKTFTDNAETEIEVNALDEEREARAGLVYPAPAHPGIVDPFAPPAHSSSLDAPAGADDLVASAWDAPAETEPDAS